jgi:hypothetical protein
MVADNLHEVRGGGTAAPGGARGGLGQRGAGLSEAPVVVGDDLVRVQPQIRRIRTKETSDVRIPDERVVSLGLQGIQILRPDVGFPAGFLDGLSLKDSSLLERRSDAGSLHWPPPAGRD